MNVKMGQREKHTHHSSVMSFHAVRSKDGRGKDQLALFLMAMPDQVMVSAAHACSCGLEMSAAENTNNTGSYFRISDINTRRAVHF